jgi:hypothetical protein
MGEAFSFNQLSRDPTSTPATTTVQGASRLPYDL